MTLTSSILSIRPKIEYWYKEEDHYKCVMCGSWVFKSKYHSIHSIRHKKNCPVTLVKLYKPKKK